MLIFPTVTTINPVTAERAGFGALREGGVFTGHYRVTSSLGCTQTPDAAQALLIVFTSRAALNAFRRSDPWRVDAAVAVLPENASGAADMHCLILERDHFVANGQPCKILVQARANDQ